MKNSFSSLILSIIVSSSACMNNGTEHYAKSLNKADNEDINAKIKFISKDFESWNKYTYYNIQLAQDFIALDTNSSLLDKIEFLKRLTTGEFIPIKMNNSSNLPSYKLYANKRGNSDIKLTIKEMALHQISNLQMEGKMIPSFLFTDLNGNKYTRSTTKGKILLLKCWFIQCIACVKEFPELNKLVDGYRKDSTIIFVSLASDNKPDLITFLKNRDFKYAVIPNSANYMKDFLGIQYYPTHIMINRNGKIVKFVNSINDLIPYLKKEIQQNNIEKNS